MRETAQLKEVKKCSATYILAVNDTMNVINGKWKLPIMGALLFGKRRFKELEREIPKISPRMLSKELRDLEANGIVSRTVHNGMPVIVEYELTESGHSFKKVLDVMVEWGLQHRKRTIGDSALRNVV
ncbi:winged helix-turn-helix transcriptional regulator [Parapedobacter tibetensis]|uniref:winged helix-turn-helix transcriptional regulator n=1 Tax=Parapedobacter tibetensis TaxID=2972951 RepID=UPI00214DCC04|nr:helix-turn-helix domain-containing protein [Parapedobacter tibetensis]